MRLTLRTLLAWLDNLLPQQDQKALGDKVAQSTAAPQLVRRIRETVARGTLPAPRVDGRGLAEDPNRAAEYLENTLAADLLESYERVCLESDIHLAEISACHALLADLIRDPAIVQPLDEADKRRLLQAVRHHLEIPRETAREAAVADGRSVRAALQAAAEPCDTVLLSPEAVAPRGRQPATSDGRRKSSRAAGLTMAAAALTLLMLVGVLIWSVARDGRRTVAAAPQAGAEKPTAAPAMPAAVAPAARGEATVPRPAAVAADEGPAANEARGRADEVVKDASPSRTASPTERSPSAKADREPQAGQPARAAEQPAATQVVDKPRESPPAATPPPAAATQPVAQQPRVPQGDALAIAAAPAVPAAAAEAAPSAATVAPTPVPRAASGIVLETGFVLRRQAAGPQQGWTPVAVGGELVFADELLAPPACRPRIAVDGVLITLEPNTLASLARDADGTPRLDVVFGRASIRGAEGAPRLGVTAGGMSGVITAGLRDWVGVEVALSRAPGSDPVETDASTTARLVTTTSAIAWQQTRVDGAATTEPLQGIAPQGMLDPAAALVWDSRDPGGVVVRRQSAAVSGWAPGPVRPDRLEESAGQAVLAAALQAGKDGTSVEEAFRALAGDRRAENRMAAAAALALLGDYGPLVDLLCADAGGLGLSEAQWTKLEQSTVPLALARGAKSAARLQKALETRLPAEVAATVLEFAGGVSDAEVAADGAQRLVDALDDERLVVRRYAYKTLLEIVRPSASERLEYRPDRPAEERRKGVAWWRRQLAQDRVRRPAAVGDSGAAPAE